MTKRRITSSISARVNLRSWNDVCGGHYIKKLTEAREAGSHKANTIVQSLKLEVRRHVSVEDMNYFDVNWIIIYIVYECFLVIEKSRQIGCNQGGHQWWFVPPFFTWVLSLSARCHHASDPIYAGGTVHHDLCQSRQPPSLYYIRALLFLLQGWRSTKSSAKCQSGRQSHVYSLNDWSISHHSLILSHSRHSYKGTRSSR